MRRFIATLAFAAVATSFSASANAGLFHKHNACCEPAPVCCEPAPISCCEADPCAKPAHFRNLVAKLHAKKHNLLAKLHAKKNSCCEPVVESCCDAPAPVCEPAPVACKPACDAAPAPCCDAAPASCCDVDPCAKPRHHHLRNLVAKIKAHKLACHKPAACCETVAVEPTCGCN